VTAAIEHLWVGKKESDAEKELKKRRGSIKRLHLKSIELTRKKALVEVRKEEIQLQKQRDEERIMTMDLSAVTEEQKTYYMRLRAKIMVQLSDA
jgi:hypothetical protein